MLNISKIISKFVKNSSQRELDRLKLIVEKINKLEPEIVKIPDEIVQAASRLGIHG